LFDELTLIVQRGFILQTTGILFPYMFSTEVLLIERLPVADGWSVPLAIFDSATASLMSILACYCRI
jgi:hypothetical protein